MAVTRTREREDCGREGEGEIVEKYLSITLYFEELSKFTDVQL